MLWDIIAIPSYLLASPTAHHFPPPTIHLNPTALLHGAYPNPRLPSCTLDSSDELRTAFRSLLGLWQSLSGPYLPPGCWGYLPPESWKNLYKPLLSSVERTLSILFSEDTNTKSYKPLFKYPLIYPLLSILKPSFKMKSSFIAIVSLFIFIIGVAGKNLATSPALFQC